MHGNVDRVRATVGVACENDGAVIEAPENEVNQSLVVRCPVGQIRVAAKLVYFQLVQGQREDLGTEIDPWKMWRHLGYIYIPKDMRKMRGMNRRRLLSH